MRVRVGVHEFAAFRPPRSLSLLQLNQQDLDQETLAHIKSENMAQSLKEEIEFLKQLHEQVRESPATARTTFATLLLLLLYFLLSYAFASRREATRTESDFDLNFNSLRALGAIRSLRKRK